MSNSYSEDFNRANNNAQKTVKIGVGIIVGISIASFVLTALCIFCIFHHQRKRNQRKRTEAEHANRKVQERREREGHGYGNVNVYGNGAGGADVVEMGNVVAPTYGNVGVGAGGESGVRKYGYGAPAYGNGTGPQYGNESARV